jgi:hypothetical protein
VEDQSFFFIEEKLDKRVLQEKSSTTIITVVKGNASARQIEDEFKHVSEGSTWSWAARAIAENMFSMRFPDAKLVQVYNNFTSIGMKAADAQIKVSSWSSAAIAKGMLQQSWFRVKGIPIDQRAVKTVAKVAGLVGKAVEIDEATRHKAGYVRVKIACREVAKVPETAKGTLGLMIYDFFFEREVYVEEGGKSGNVAIAVHDSGNPPSPKRPRREGPTTAEEKGPDQGRMGSQIGSSGLKIQSNKN